MHVDDLPKTTGTVYYTKESSEDLYSYVYTRGPGSQTEDESKKEFSNLERIESQVQVRDMRPVADQFSLKANGVVLRGLNVPAGIDWSNAEEVRIAHIAPHTIIALLVKITTGRVYILPTHKCNRRL